MSLLLLISVASATPLVRYSLESSDGGFTESGETGQWAWGAVENGPGSGVGGLNAWSTGLTADYLNDATDYLIIPVPDLSGIERPMLSFSHWYEIAMGDAGWVELDIGNGWTTVEPLYGYPTASGFSGASGGWRTVVVDLTGFGPNPELRLAFASDLAGVGAGWTVDEVAFDDGDVAAPKLGALTELADTDDLAGPYTVEIAAEDDTSVVSVELHWDAGAGEASVEMTRVADDLWRGALPAAAPDTVVTYWVEADDGLNTAREPLDDDRSFRVYLPAPTELTGPLGRVVDTDVLLTWTAPVSRNAVVSYEVVRDGVVVATSTTTSASAPLSGGFESFTVRAVYEAGPGDASEPFEVDGVLPSADALVPDEAWPEDSVRLLLTGTYLVLVDGEVSVDLGAGVEVVGVEVRDVDTAWIDIYVDPSAAAGPRMLTLQSGPVTLEVPDAFDVLDGGGRPRLDAVDPEFVRQGVETELVFTVVGGLEGLPTVDLGEGVIVESVWVEGDTVHVLCAVANDAALGERVPTIDDGVRVLDGVRFEVKDGVAPAADVCGLPAAPSGWLGLGGLVLLVRRRREASRRR